MARETTGPARQLTGEELQIGGSEVQAPDLPGVLPRIEEPPRREPPGPARPSAPPGPPLTGEQFQDLLRRQQTVGLPVLFVNRYEGGDQTFQELVRWDIPQGLVADLHEISLATNLASRTRYRIIVGNREMSLPDRQMGALLAFPFRANVIPGGTSITVEVRSTDGTPITVDSFISGTER
jgi:hypothetical protein